jgi:hypothetical protein
LLREAPLAAKDEVGEVLRNAYGLLWAELNDAKAGSTFRAWAKIAGIKVSRPAKKGKTKKDLP